MSRSTSKTLIGIMALACLAICGPAKAIDRDRRLDQLYHTAWTSRDGAPSRARSMVQTTDGFLWFGGQTGLYRFDGIRFERYDSASGVQLPKTEVASLIALPEGGLLIGWGLSGVSLLKNGQVTDYGGPGSGFPEGAQVERFQRAPDGVIWALLSYRGAYRLDAEGRWHEFGSAWPVSENPPLFGFDRNGTVWVGTESKTFFLPRGDEKFHELPDGTSSIAETPDGVVWAAGYSSVRPIVHYVPGRRILPALSVFNADGLVFVDSQGSLWGARNDDGLFRIAYPERALAGQHFQVEKFTAADGLSHDHVVQILQDREGNIWVTTPSGVDRFRQSNVVPVKVPKSGGYTFLDRTAEGIRVIASFPPTVMTIVDGAVSQIRPWPFETLYVYQGKQNITWLGTAARGLMRDVNDRFQPVDSPGKGIGSITEDGQGRLWAIIGGKGPYRWENGKWTSLMDLGGPRGSRSAFTDSQGRVWFGNATDRVVLVDGEKLRVFTEKDGINVGSVLDIGEITGMLFVGGDRGLDMFTGSEFVALRPSDAESFKNIWALVTSERSGLWFAEERGLVHIPVEELREARANRKHAVSYDVFDVYDGLSEGPQRSGFRPPSMESADGRIWFATQTGIVWVDPQRIIRNPVPPNVSIESLTVGEKTYHLDSRLNLPPHTANIRISFTATSLTVPERVRFRYRLEGADLQWQDAGTRREAVYTNLGPGTYLFRVIACNNDGIWNETGAQTGFGIAPTFYQTMWFRLALVLASVLLVLELIRWRMRRMAAGLNQRFEERLEERTRLARDFHDTLLQTIQATKLVADNTLEQNADLPLMRSTLEELSEWLGRAVHEGRSALSSLRSSIKEGNELAEAFQRAAEEYRFGHPLELKLVVEGARQDLHPIVRDEVYRIGYEAIRNAFTHSGGSRVDVELSYVSDLVLRVRDDGRGIHADAGQKAHEGHFGMVGMHERAARIGAKLTVSTSPAGTQVELRVPRGVVFRTSASSPTSAFRRLTKLFRAG